MNDILWLCRTSPLRSVVEASEVNASAAVTIATDISPDSAIVVDSAVTDDQLHSKSVVCASPLTHLVRLSSLAFKREGASPADPNLIRSSLPGKFFQRFRGNGTGSGGGVHSTPQYYYTPLTGFDGGSLRRSNSHGAIKSLPGNCQFHLEFPSVWNHWFISPSDLFFQIQFTSNNMNFFSTVTYITVIFCLIDLIQLN